MSVRKSLNLPRLRVGVRRGRDRSSWSVCLESGRSHSEWITLDARSVAVIKKVGLLPPMHLGTFRLAYDAMQDKKLGARS